MTSIVIQLSKNIFGSTKWLEKRNIFESMKPFYYVAKFYGFAPFQFTTNYPKVKGIDYFFVAFNFICYLYIIYVQVAVETFYHHGFKCVDIGIKFFYFTSSCVSLTTLIRIFCNRHKIRKIFEQLYDIDVEVYMHFLHQFVRTESFTFEFQFKSYGPEVSHRKHFIVLLSFVTFYFLMQLSLVLNIHYFYYQLTDGTITTNFLIHMVVFIYNVGGYLAVLSYYLFSVMAVTCRIALLNDNIR